MPEQTTHIATGLRDSLGNLSVGELQSALGVQLKALAAYAGQYPWLHSIYEKFVIVECGGKYYRHNYSTSGSTITLSSTRQEVRIAWQADAVTTQLSESDRRNRGTHIKQEGGFREAFEPTAPNEAGISESCVLLRAGTNKSGRRHYTPEFIREHLDRFDGAMCHMDHPTMSESRDRPERTMGTLAAVVRNPRWQETVAEGGATQGAVVGDLEFLATDAGRNMQAAFGNPVVREKAGLSIYWPGPVKVARRKLGGSLVDVPLQLLGDGQFNVDFVTRPNAGGRVGPLKESEADADMDIADVTLEMLEAERPELIEAVRQGYVKQPEPAAKPQTGMSEAERTEFEALKARGRRADAKDIVDAKLAEAQLPEAVKTEIRADFAEAECTDATAFAAVVDAKIARMKTLAESLQPRGARGVVAEPPPAGGRGKSAQELMAEDKPTQ